MAPRSSQTIWLARHGTRIDNVDPDWPATAARPFDPHLHPTGAGEARKLAAALAEAPIDVVYASPFLRALQTATPIADATGAPLRIDAGLGEWLRDIWFEQTPVLFPEAKVDWRCDRLERDYCSPARLAWPESWSAAMARTGEAIRRLAATGENLIAVGHGASVIGMLAGLRGVTPEYDAPAPPLASLFKLVRADDAWRLVLEADTTHVDGGDAGRAWAAMTRQRGTDLLPAQPEK